MCPTDRVSGSGKGGCAGVAPFPFEKSRTDVNFKAQQVRPYMGLPGRFKPRPRSDPGSKTNSRENFRYVKDPLARCGVGGQRGIGVRAVVFFCQGQLSLWTGDV